MKDNQPITKERNYERFMDDPDIINEPYPLREIHAIRFAIQEEMKTMTTEEYNEKVRKETEQLAKEYGFTHLLAKYVLIRISPTGNGHENWCYIECDMPIEIRLPTTLSKCENYVKELPKNENDEYYALEEYLAPSDIPLEPNAELNSSSAYSRLLKIDKDWVENMAMRIEPNTNEASYFVSKGAVIAWIKTKGIAICAPKEA
jgi:hypothetical protein